MKFFQVIMIIIFSILEKFIKIKKIIMKVYGYGNLISDYRNVSSYMIDNDSGTFTHNPRNVYKIL